MGCSHPGLALCAAAALAIGRMSLAAPAVGEIRGAGATFPAPVYAAWALDYEKSSGVRVTYDPVGSGAGIERIRTHQVDFGASDAPLSVPELATAGLIQFPAVIGGVVPVINIRGIKPGELKLDGAVLAEIYLGRIRRWNDARIAALNPNLALPGTNITVVHRSDRSGSSLLWSDYLSRSSTLWQGTVGASIAPQWPAGVGGDGNDGVASYVQRTRFALGYVEYAFARAHRLSDVALINHSGHVVRAGPATFGAAAEAANWNADITQQMATDPPGDESWPVTGASFILMEKSPAREASAIATLRFFEWALRQDQAAPQRLDYLPVPEPVVKQLPQLWRTIRDRSGTPAWPR